MHALRSVPLSARGAALVPGGGLAVHQLRYALAYGSGAESRLVAQGHAYLAALTPWIVLLAGLALGASLGRLASRAARGRDGVAAPVGPRVLRVWAAATLLLVAIYVGQELLEGMLASGHPGGLAGVFGGGGWCALPAAGLIGALLALALHGEAAVQRLLTRPGIARPRLASAPLGWVRVEAARAPLVPLAGAAAGRAPPLAAQLA